MIKTVFDPEIPVDIYELGLIYDIIVDAERRVLIKMTLTSPACPSAQQIAERSALQGQGRSRRHRRLGRDRLGAAVGQGSDVGSGEAAARVLLCQMSDAAPTCTRKSSSTTTGGRGISARWPTPIACAHGHNPLCGDKLSRCTRRSTAIASPTISFEGSGCAISKASASLMTDAVKGRTVAEALALFERVHDAWSRRRWSDGRRGRTSASWRCFAGVREFPAAREVRLARLAHAQGRARGGSRAATE